MTGSAEAVTKEARALAARWPPAQATAMEGFMFKTIIAATDGSAHAERAVDLAGDIAEKYGARLVLLHVLLHGHIPEALRHMAEIEHMVPPAQPVPPVPVLVPELMEHIAMAQADTRAMRQIFAELGDQILRRAERAARKKGVKDIATRVDDGDPARRIIECAKAEDADLIVLGSRGLGDLEGLFMGSVSHKVSHLAECSCVTVK